MACDGLEEMTRSAVRAMERAVSDTGRERKLFLGVGLFLVWWFCTQDTGFGCIGFEKTTVSGQLEVTNRGPGYDWVNRQCAASRRGLSWRFGR